MTNKLTEEEIKEACRIFRNVLLTGTGGEFHIGNKVYVAIYNEPRRD